MSTDSTIKLDIDFPDGMVKPIPHYIQIRNLALDLAFLLLSLPNLDSVMDDISAQSGPDNEYETALSVMGSIINARDTLEAEIPELHEVAEVLRDSMHQWGPAMTAINFLVIQYPDETGKVVSGFIKDFAVNEIPGGTDEEGT